MSLTTKKDKIVKIAQTEYSKLQDLLGIASSSRKISKKYFYWWIGDIQSLMELYVLVFNEEWYKAYKFSRNLDSDCREKINRQVHNFLES